MIFKNAQEEFAVRYYRWSRLQASKEVADGYPLLKRMDHPSCRKYLRRMAQLSIEDQQAFTSLLVKWRHLPEIVEVSGDAPLSCEEIAEVKGYLGGLAYELDPASVSYYRRLQQGDPTANLDKRRFRKTLREHLAPLLGKGDPSGGADWTCSTIIENLLVETYIDTGGRTALHYYHDIIFSEHQYMGRGISVLGWLGLSGGTSWYQLEDSKAEETASFLAELCERFLKAAPELLKGLAP